MILHFNLWWGGVGGGEVAKVSLGRRRGGMRCQVPFEERGGRGRESFKVSPSSSCTSMYRLLLRRVASSGEKGGEEEEWVSPLPLPPSSSSLILFPGPHASLLHGEHGHGKKEVDGLGGTQSATKIVDTAAQLHPHKHVHKPPKRSV